MTENGKINNEDGFVLVASLLILLLLVVIGTSAVTNSTIEIQIAGNERAHKQAFYAAEAARAYVEATPGLYDPNNLDTDVGVNFPDADDPTAVQLLGAAQSFSGVVKFEKVGGDSDLLETGTQAGTNLKPIIYKMIIAGNGPTNALSRVEAGFVGRIGL